ncbi:hypothetical protein CASFOL_033725 [Castilleja foliolosa]|uniref:C2H2-type domain-containing protein n=1 Tax=Castilleja foliolosa TaxID=1961234 RepID=A0ABD3BZ13_9LAMI
MTILIIKSAPKLPPPCEFTPDEFLAAEGLLMLSQQPPVAAICSKKTQEYLALLPPLPSYVCKICDVAFETHQALGGHKTRHRKLAAPTVSGSRNNDRVHECSICQKRFSTGQALGGHKRQHYEGKIGGPSKSAKTSSTGCPGRVSGQVTVIEDDGSSKSAKTSSIGSLGRVSAQVTVVEDEGPSHASSRVLDFDLNLPYTQDISE